MNTRSEQWARRGRQVLAGGMAALFAVGLVGCEKADWENPAYVNQKLAEGDATSRRMALEKVREIPQDQRTALVPGLSKYYLDNISGQKDAMTHLVQLRHPDGKEAYLAEVRSNATGFAGAAARALGQADVREAIPALLEQLGKTDSPDIKVEILQALSAMPDGQSVKPAVEILKLDVDNHPIALHAFACELLGNIAQREPDALDVQARRTLVYSVFLANERGQNVGRECGLAVQQAGASMVEPLLELFRGENEQVTRLLMAYNRPDTFAFPANHARLVAAVRLTGLRAKEAVAPFMEDLSKPKAAPSDVSGNHAVQWRMREGQLTDELIMGLGDIGDPAARPILEQVLLGQRNDAWDDITDGLVELQLRQNAAFALNRLGDRAALPALMRMARDGVIIDLERRAAMLQQRGQPVSMLERYQFNWMVAQAYAGLATGAQKADFEKLINDTKEEDLKKKYQSFLVMFDVEGECAARGEAPARAACYGEKLKDENELVREKAAYELMRLPAEHAGPVLVDNLSTTKLETRELITLGLYRAPAASAVAKIAEILQRESGRSGPEFRLDHSRLRMLRAWLNSPRGAGVQAAQ
jgi:HEAT repeat protein